MGERGTKALSVGYWVRRLWRVRPARSFSPESVSQSLCLEHSRLGERVGIKMSYKTLRAGESWEKRPFMKSRQGHSSWWALMMGFWASGANNRNTLGVQAGL